METIRAIYEKGVLRPLRPLNLRERQTVHLQVLPEEAAVEPGPVLTEDEAGAIVRILVATGMVDPPLSQENIPPDPVSQEERQRLAETLGRLPGQPASEMVLEDRGEW